MNGLPDDKGDRGIAADTDFLCPDRQRSPRIIEPDAGAGGIEFFHVEVRVVHHRVGDTPGDRIVPAGDNPRGPGNRHPPRVVSRATELNLVPLRRKRELKVSVVCQDDLPGRGFGGPHNPGVAPRGEGVRTGEPEEGFFCSPHPRRQGGNAPFFLRGDHRSHVGGIRGHDLEQLLRPDLLADGPERQISPPGQVQLPGHQPPDQQAVGGSPGFRVVPQQVELHGVFSLRPGQKGVHAGRIGLQYPSGFPGEGPGNSFGGPAEPHNAEHPVKGDRLRAEQLRKTAGRDPPLHIHLPQTILRMDETLSERHVLLRGRNDRRNAVFIPKDLDRRAEAPDVPGALGNRERGPDLIPDEQHSGDHEKEDNRTDTDDQFRT